MPQALSIQVLDILDQGLPKLTLRKPTDQDSSSDPGRSSVPKSKKPKKVPIFYSQRTN
jgi:hypothetical protein